MTINVLGYGIMGKQIASLLYLGGFDVCIWNYKEVDEKLIYKQIKLLKRSIDFTKEGSLTFVTEINKLPKAITIESVKEDLETKKHIYAECATKEFPYFSNSSSFSPSEIGPEVNGLHFFNPISLGLVELFLKNQKIKKDIQPILEYLYVLKFEIVEVKNNRGYVGNYILFHEISSALKLIEKYGYNANNINSIYIKLYNGRNIFLIIDLIGIDVVFKILKNLKENDETIYLPSCLSLALEKNILGKKNKTSILTILN